MSGRWNKLGVACEVRSGTSDKCCAARGSRGSLSERSRLKIEQRRKRGLGVSVCNRRWPPCSRVSRWQMTIFLFATQPETFMVSSSLLPT